MLSTTSPAASLASRLKADPSARSGLEALSERELSALGRHWPFWARPSQLAPPGEWLTWLILAGRGWGKTRTGAEFIRQEVKAGRAKRIALVARTAADVRDVVVEGESGLLAIHPAHERPTWNSSRRRLEWPNGAIATTYSAEEPDQLRGPQHDLAWCDEPAAWRYPETWDQLRFGLRLGPRPRTVATTTPRPTALIRALVADPSVVVTRGATCDNAANLSPGVVADLDRKYAGTRLGRQELLGEILDDAPGALWKRAWIDDARVRAAPEFRRVVVAVDPAVSHGEDADETGIVVVGLGWDGKAYLIADATGRMPPEKWARTVVDLYHRHRADRVIAEVNQGGTMVEHTLRVVDRAVSYRPVHAKRGKALRAEPVAALYEQGRVCHVGAFSELEDQLCLWQPGDPDSPDRLDALVYALTDLIVDAPMPRNVGEGYHDL